MSDKKLQENLDDAILSLAVSDMLDEYGRQLIEEYEQIEDKQGPDEESYSKFMKRLNKAYRKKRFFSMFKSSGKVMRRAVTVCAVCIVVFAVSVVSVDAFRFRFLEWLDGIHEKFTSVSVIDENDNPDYLAQFGISLELPYTLPTGYRLKSATEDNGVNIAVFDNGEYEITLIAYELEQVINTDMENMEYNGKVNINNYVGYYTNKDGNSNLTWYTDTKSFQMFTNDVNISEGEFVDIAQSVK